MRITDVNFNDEMLYPFFANENEMIGTMILKNGDTLYDPYVSLNGRMRKLEFVYGDITEIYGYIDTYVNGFFTRLTRYK